MADFSQPESRLFIFDSVVASVMAMISRIHGPERSEKTR